MYQFGPERIRKVYESSRRVRGAVANRWGFRHMENFAADYRKQVGELPTETLRRRSGVRA